MTWLRIAIGVGFGVRIVFRVGAFDFSHPDSFHFVGKATRPSRRPKKVGIGNAIAVVFRSVPRMSRYQAMFLRKARSRRVSSSTRKKCRKIETMEPR